MVEQPDFVLMHRARRGDDAAFTRLVERYQQRMYGLVYGMLRNPHDARDALQETFVAAYRALRNFREDAQFSTWLHQIAVNKARDQMRRRIDVPVDVHEDYAADAANSGRISQFAQSDLQHELLRALERLDEGFREAFVLVDMLDVPIAEAASVLEVSIGTIKSRVFRARERMANMLLDAGFTPPDRSGTFSPATASQLMNASTPDNNDRGEPPQQ